MTPPPPPSPTNYEFTVIASYTYLVLGQSSTFIETSHFICGVKKLSACATVTNDQSSKTFFDFYIGKSCAVNALCERHSLSWKPNCNGH